MKKISIVVPIYNSAQYLRDTIGSVLNQTYTNWELILIDDCSTDNSKWIALSFAESDIRIKVMSTGHNSGPAHARNIGIENASGEYIGFLDSDDSLKPQFIEKMLNAIVKFGADVVWCQYDEVDTTGKNTPVLNKVKKNIVYNRKDMVRLLFQNEPGIDSLCNKLYKKDVLQENMIRLDEKRRYAEDKDFNIKVFLNANSLVAIEESLYEYIRQNPKSLMATYRPNDFIHACESIDYLQEIKKMYSVEIPRFFWGRSYLNFMMGYSLRTIRQKNRLSVSTLKSIVANDKFQLVSHDTKLNELPFVYRLLCILMRNGHVWLAYQYGVLINFLLNCKRNNR